jgi:hypothetical protein
LPSITTHDDGFKREQSICEIKLHLPGRLHPNLNEKRSIEGSGGSINISTISSSGWIVGGSSEPHTLVHLLIPDLERFSQ